MGELEQQYGKEKAITLARQTYYNSDVWNLAAGSEKASDDQVLALGLPHKPGEKDNGPFSGGYMGPMRTLDGQPVDMGHVLCGMDWQINKDRAPDSLKVDDLTRAVGHGEVGKVLKEYIGDKASIPNPFDLGFVTLEGDLGSAVKESLGGTSPDDAVAEEGDYDWNSDLDGLNLAKRLETHPNQSLADALGGYYDSGEYKNRADEFATHSEYVKRDGNGQPVKDKNGHYEMDTEKMAEDSFLAGLLLSKGDPKVLAGGVLDKLNPFSDKAEDVAESFEKWLHRSQDAA